jgi:inhibitor of cysteine peptidase
MTNKSLLIFTFAIILVVAAACSSPTPAKLTSADNGKTIEVKTGDQITIVLAGNPSTGYNWLVKDPDTSMLQQIGEAEFKSDNPGLIGSGGTLTLTFKALKAGTTTLSLSYQRPWETDVKPLDTYSVTLTVK